MTTVNQEMKLEQAKIRRSMQVYAKRSPLYHAFQVKAEKQNTTVQNCLKEMIIKMKKQSRGGISVFHNFKIYCKKKELRVFDELEDMMREFIHN